MEKSLFILALIGFSIMLSRIIIKWIEKRVKTNDPRLPVDVIKKMVLEGKPVPLCSLPTLPYRLRKRIEKKDPCLSLQYVAEHTDQLWKYPKNEQWCVMKALVDIEIGILNQEILQKWAED